MGTLRPYVPKGFERGGDLTKLDPVFDRDFGRRCVSILIRDSMVNDIGE